MRALRISKSCCDKFLTAHLLGVLFDMHLAKSGFVSVRFAKFTHFIKACFIKWRILQIYAPLTKHTLLKIQICATTCLK